MYVNIVPSKDTLQSYFGDKSTNGLPPNTTADHVTINSVDGGSEMSTSCQQQPPLTSDCIADDSCCCMQHHCLYPSCCRADGPQPSECCDGSASSPTASTAAAEPVCNIWCGDHSKFKILAELPSARSEIRMFATTAVEEEDGPRESESSSPFSLYIVKIYFPSYLDEYLPESESARYIRRTMSHGGANTSQQRLRRGRRNPFLHLRDGRLPAVPTNRLAVKEEIRIAHKVRSLEHVAHIAAWGEVTENQLRNSFDSTTGPAAAPCSDDGRSAPSNDAALPTKQHKPCILTVYPYYGPRVMDLTTNSPCIHFSAATLKQRWSMLKGRIIQNFQSRHSSLFECGWNMSWQCSVSLTPDAWSTDNGNQGLEATDRNRTLLADEVCDDSDRKPIGLSTPIRSSKPVKAKSLESEDYVVYTEHGARQIVLMLIDALIGLQNRGLVHRDVSPANICISYVPLNWLRSIPQPLLPVKRNDDPETPVSSPSFKDFSGDERTGRRIFGATRKSHFDEGKSSGSGSSPSSVDGLSTVRRKRLLLDQLLKDTKPKRDIDEAVCTPSHTADTYIRQSRSLSFETPDHNLTSFFSHPRCCDAHYVNGADFSFQGKRKDSSSNSDSPDGLNLKTTQKDTVDIDDLYCNGDVDPQQLKLFSTTILSSSGTTNTHTTTSPFHASRVPETPPSTRHHHHHIDNDDDDLLSPPPPPPPYVAADLLPSSESEVTVDTTDRPLKVQHSVITTTKLKTTSPPSFAKYRRHTADAVHRSSRRLNASHSVVPGLRFAGPDLVSPFVPLIGWNDLASSWHIEVPPDVYRTTRRITSNTSMRSNDGIRLTLIDFGGAAYIESPQTTSPRTDDCKTQVEERGTSGTPYFIPPECLSREWWPQAWLGRNNGEVLSTKEEHSSSPNDSRLYGSVSTGGVDRSNNYIDGEKRHVWSLGAIIATLVSGHPPLHLETDGEWGVATQWAILKGTANGWLPTNVPLSASLKDLLKRCLDNDPSKRSSLQEVIQHPWLAAPSD